MPPPAAPEPVVLITGAARRLGAAMARHFHSQGYRVAIHYRHSRGEAAALAAELCAARPHSAVALPADLADLAALTALPALVQAAFGRLDVLINNASSFFPTPLGQVDERQWDALVDSNLKGPFFLSQACLPPLRACGGSIINLIDIHAERPLRDHTVYCLAKAGLAMIPRALALEASPEVRANGIAPGAMLWPESAPQSPEQAAILARIPQGRCGQPLDIAQTAWFLATQAPYVTGQIIAVDGGRSTAG